MSSNETNYGNFAEPKAPFASRRSEEVVLLAVKRCEELEDKVMGLEAELFECVRIIYKNPDYQRWCEANFPEIVKKLRGEK